MLLSSKFKFNFSVTFDFFNYSIVWKMEDFASFDNSFVESFTTLIGTWSSKMANILNFGYRKHIGHNYYCLSDLKCWNIGVISSCILSHGISVSDSPSLPALTKHKSCENWYTTEDVHHWKKIVLNLCSVGGSNSL